MSPPTRSTGRIAAIDYGTVRLGVAITDPEQTLASPLANYTRRGPTQDAQYLRQLVQDEQIVRFIVGLPIHLDGRESQKSGEARRFGQWLHAETGVPVEFFDERFTSVEAESYLQAAALTSRQRRRRRDMLAAQILLSAYLESDRRHDSAPPRSLDDA